MPINPDDAEQLRHLIHELTEALTAADAYLYPYQRRAVSEPNAYRDAYQRRAGFEPDEKIGNAIEQIGRASDVVARLRSIVSDV
jgi:hypothetical protein